MSNPLENIPRVDEVLHILNNPHEAQWSAQGFGMLRTYLGDDKVWRLNVWHSALAVENVSTIHDHPWDFTSWIVAGRFTNQRFTEAPVANFQCKGVKIKTGEGGGAVGLPFTQLLYAHDLETYLTGDTYSQKWNEIHRSSFVDGTVTLNRRDRVGDGEHAQVFWEDGDWVNAEPRPATAEEVAFVMASIVIETPLIETPSHLTQERFDAAYAERNHLVAALAKVYPSGLRKTDIPGWDEEWQGCCTIDLPTGQISYHYHDSEAYLFEGLPPYRGEYDGHTEEIVHERLRGLPTWSTLSNRTIGGSEHQLRLDVQALYDQLELREDLQDVGVRDEIRHRLRLDSVAFGEYPK